MEYYFNGLTADPASILYPIGTNANAVVRYTPATLDMNSISDDGFVRIRTSDTELQTVDQSALSGNMLTYYWRTSHSGFSTLPTVESYTLTAVDTDDPDSGATPTSFNASFVPGKVLDASPYTRSQESVSDISGLVITFNGTGAGFTLENANYTAGDGTSNLFSGIPEVFYTVNGTRQNWNVQSKWTKTSDGVDDGNSGVPGVGDVAILKSYGNGNADHWVNVNTNITVAEVIFDGSLGGWSPRMWVTDRDAILDLGPVSGDGTIYLEVTEADIASFIGNTDLGAFSNNAGSEFNFKIDADNQTVNMPNNILVYPNLRIEAGDGNNDDNNRILQTSVPITINGYVRMDRSPRWRINHDVLIKDDLRITWQGNRTTVELGDDREVVVEVMGDLNLENGQSNDGARIIVKNDNLNGYVHTLKVGGDINFEASLNGSSSFDLYNGTGLNNNAILELNGSGVHSFTNLSPAIVPDLYRIVVNKGTSTASSFTFNNSFVLNGLNTIPTPVLDLQNGKAIFNNAAISLNIANGVSFTIPPTAGLQVAQGTITSTNSTLILNGLLKVAGGTIDLGTSAIEYSSTGAALIELSSGKLEVGYQVRRSTSNTSGILKFRQTGGDFDVAVDGAPTSSRAAFEVLNTGSEFTLTGGTFNIQRGVTGDANKSLELNPDTYNVTGSTITLGENLGAGYGANFFNVKCHIPLNNLTLANSSNRLPDVRLYTQPLTVGNLTINSNERIIANGFNLNHYWKSD